MQDIKFSIVVPIYNSENYLEECVNSVIKQTYSNWELILIDDGSNDSSPQICDRYAKQDERIVVIHQTNKGQFASRLVGIKKSTGDYLLFSDSDDCLFDDTLDTILNYCKDGRDAIFFSYSKQIERSSKVNSPPLFYNQNSLPEIRRLILLNKYSSMSAKCIKSSLLKSIFIDNKYLEKNYGEDFIHTLVLSDYLNNVVVLNDQLFFYRQHSNSTSHSGIDFFSFSEMFNFGVFELQEYYMQKWKLDSKDVRRDIISYWLNYCCTYLIEAITNPKFKLKTTKDYLKCRFFGEKQDEFMKNIEYSNLSKKKKNLLISYYKNKRFIFSYIKFRIHLHSLFLSLQKTRTKKENRI